MEYPGHISISALLVVGEIQPNVAKAFVIVELVISIGVLFIFGFICFADKLKQRRV